MELGRTLNLDKTTGGLRRCSKAFKNRVKTEASCAEDTYILSNIQNLDAIGKGPCGVAQSLEAFLSPAVGRSSNE